METNPRIIVPVLFNKQTYIIKTCFNVVEWKFHWLNLFINFFVHKKFHQCLAFFYCIGVVVVHVIISLYIMFRIFYLT